MNEESDLSAADVAPPLAKWIRDSAIFFDSVKLWVHPDHKEKFASHLNRISLVADYLDTMNAAQAKKANHVTIWLNVYPGIDPLSSKSEDIACFAIHYTKELADRSASIDRIRCVEVDLGEV